MVDKIWLDTSTITGHYRNGIRIETQINGCYKKKNLAKMKFAFTKIMLFSFFSHTTCGLLLKTQLMMIQESQDTTV